MNGYLYPAMNHAQHTFCLQPAPTQRDSETIDIVSRRDVQWGRPIFRAPALPTARQLSSELPFTVNFRPRLKRSR